MLRFSSPASGPLTGAFLAGRVIRGIMTVCVNKATRAVDGNDGGPDRFSLWGHLNERELFPPVRHCQESLTVRKPFQVP